ncbi:PREDICTED: liprin-beta-2-like isoform X2 [Nicrophorus vespilloides]|uniref:Liprin-beta-2-like isoform X2 n=1 Tax=Nicrophorus vespilloides TaxID=110193 RepID=A0ABM1M4X7_NICVS|nr:PREDICTED: liprin-beta-2-like isoform X2 [Nicrophorus vespilloides]
MRDVCKGAVVAAAVAVIEKNKEVTTRLLVNKVDALPITNVLEDQGSEDSSTKCQEWIENNSGAFLASNEDAFISGQFVNVGRSYESSKPKIVGKIAKAIGGCEFDEAVKDFDLTAEDVRKFVAESMKHCESKDVRETSVTPSTDYVASDDFESSSSDGASSSSSEGCANLAGLATIAEEVTASSVQSSEDGSSSDASITEDDGTVKDDDAWCNGSQSSSTSTSSARGKGCLSLENHMQTVDSSMRCNGDFQWISKDKKMEEVQSKPPINRRERTPRRSAENTPPGGSLDRRRHAQQSRQERDQKSRSSHVLKSPSPQHQPPPRLDDYVQPQPQYPCQNWCCNPHGAELYFENFHRRHERTDPQRYGSSPMLMDRFVDGNRGSHPDLYRPGEMPCYAYHVPPHHPPPFYYYGDSRGYHWTPNKPPDQDERMRKLQGERDNLQLQVQVLSEQIEAQGDKITDLEKCLAEKKQQLINSEDLLQREMLSRSSLETQKLELLSTVSELKLQQATLERENMELRSAQMNNNADNKKPPYISRISPQPTHTSTPVHNSNSVLRKSPSPSPISGSLAASPRRVESVSSLNQDSPKTPPTGYRRQIELHYASLPRQQFLGNGTALSVVDANANPANGVRKGVAFAETEKIVIDENSELPQSPSLQMNKSKGIKKILGKIKRSGSGNLEDFSCGEFQRGGIRATASARLGWSEPNVTPKPDKPFSEWDTENICDWLQDLGLDQYVTEAKRWVKTGQQLQESGINEIEKELGIKNPLHKKKLQLALIDTEANSSNDPYLSKAGQLDTAWVLRWLDDTGLPQHKETFLMNRVDGRVLHRLTMDDLALLHVSSLLHVASIKRGIQVLREHSYEPSCLQRRSLPDDPDNPTPKQVSLWTTHRVMEWLKAVDLAEYAPYLRGAGVHGGLMVLENKFNAELLASLLSIPPDKTLLRRHLSTRFKELLGKEIIQAKREAESTFGYIPLTPASKLKIAKKSHFSLKRNKSKSEADYGDLVCPLNQNSGENYQSGSSINSVGMTRRSAKDEDVCPLAEEESVNSSSSSNSPLPLRNDTHQNDEGHNLN